jgi:hypothetical protein
MGRFPVTLYEQWLGLLDMSPTFARSLLPTKRN